MWLLQRRESLPQAREGAGGVVSLESLEVVLPVHQETHAPARRVGKV